MAAAVVLVRSVLCKIPRMVSSECLYAAQTRCYSDLRYSKSHEWVRAEGGICTVGLSKYAVDTLGDVVFIDLPDPGTHLKTDGELIPPTNTLDTFGNAESTKVTSELHSPINGIVERVNEALKDKPSLLNKSPLNEGWLIKMKTVSDNEIDGLMSEEEYQNYLRSADC